MDGTGFLKCRQVLPDEQDNFYKIPEFALCVSTEGPHSDELLLEHCFLRAACLPISPWSEVLVNRRDLRLI